MRDLVEEIVAECKEDILTEQVIDSTILSNESDFLRSIIREVAQESMREELKTNTDILFDSFFEQVVHRVLLS